MKELSIEEKAKRYDEAKRRGLDYIRLTPATELVTRQSILEHIFPELKESEDERIRKELLSVVNDLVLPDEQQSRFVAWLEKQGEHAKFLNSIQVGDQVTRNENGELFNLSQLKRVSKPAEKQGEQKPLFKKGDTVIWLGEEYNILDVTKDSYYCGDFFGYHPDYCLTDEEEQQIINDLRNKKGE